jgi:MFS family permease
LFIVGVLHSSKANLAFIEGLAVLLVALMSAWVGVRSDRIGKRVVWIRWGYGLAVAGKGVLAFANSWGWVLGGRLLDRFGKGLRGAPRDALISEIVSADQRGRAFGVHRMLDTAGALLGVLISALLLWWLTGSPEETQVETAIPSEQVPPAWVFRFIFGVGTALGLISWALTILVREPDRIALKGQKSTMDDERPIPDSRLDVPKLPRSYWWLLAVISLFSLANSSDAFLILRASELGFSPWTVVMIYAIYNVTYAGLSFPFGSWSDRLGRWRMILWGWGIYVVVYLCFAFVTPALAWSLWPLMALYGVYMALTDGVGKALIADASPRERRGAAMGIYFAVTGLMTLAGSLITGVVWDRTGSKYPFLIGAGFAALAMLAVFISRIKPAKAN